MKASLLINGDIQLFMRNIAAWEKKIAFSDASLLIVVHSCNQCCHGNLTSLPSCILSH